MTQISHQSFGSRMCGGLCGCLFGVSLSVAAIALAGWNEGTYVSMQEVLAATHSRVQEYDCHDENTPRDGTTLVFLSGCQLTGQPRWSFWTSRPGCEGAMPGSGCTPAGGAWFWTTVEMYQWTETEHSETSKDSVGGGTTTVKWWSHSLRWSGSHLRSPTHCDQSGGPHTPCDPRTACLHGYDPLRATPSRAGEHCNPDWDDGFRFPSAPIDGVAYAANKTVRLGDSGPWLNHVQLRKLTSRLYVAPPAESLTGDAERGAQLPIARLTPTNSRISGSVGVTSAPTAGPRVGDVRVTWSVNAAQSASVLAAVGSDGVMVPWRSNVSSRVAGLDTSVIKLQEGEVEWDAFLSNMKEESDAEVTGYRVISFVLLWVGAALFLRPLSIAPDLIPWVGPAVGDLAAGLICLASLVLTTCTFLLTIGICWLVFRPAVGVPLLLAVMAIAYAAVWLRRRAKRRAEPTQFHRYSEGMLPATPQYGCHPSVVAGMAQPHLVHAGQIAMAMPVVATPVGVPPEAEGCCSMPPEAPVVAEAVPMGMPVV